MQNRPLQIGLIILLSTVGGSLKDKGISNLQKHYGFFPIQKYKSKIFGSRSDAGYELSLPMYS